MANNPGKPEKSRPRFCTLLNHEVVDPKEFMVHFAKRRKNEIIIQGQVCGWCYNIDYLKDEKTKFKKKRPNLSDASVTKQRTTSPRRGAIADNPRQLGGDQHCSEKSFAPSGDEIPTPRDLKDKPGDLA